MINKSIGISKTGFAVIGFTNGKEALHYFMLDPDKNLPQIILLDIEMPIMDGWDFLNEIALLNTQNTTIYIVSSSISHEDKEKAKAFPKIKGFFSKPITVDTILQITEAFKK